MLHSMNIKSRFIFIFLSQTLENVHCAKIGVNISMKFHSKHLCQIVSLGEINFSLHLRVLGREATKQFSLGMHDLFGILTVQNYELHYQIG